MIDVTKLALQGVWVIVVAAVVALSLAFGVGQYLRVEGYKFLFFEAEGYKPAYERVKVDNANLIAASKEATRLQQEANDKAEADYRQTAKEIDDAAVQELTDELARAERFIANSLRSAQASRDSAACPVTAADNYSAGSSDEARAEAIVDGAEAGMVLVLPEDVRICTVNTLQAEAAREWAQRLMNPDL